MTKAGVLKRQRAHRRPAAPIRPAAADAGHRSRNRAANDTEVLAHILGMLRGRTGIDFAQYGQAGIQRRLSRAMKLRGIGSLREYDRFIEREPVEAGRLSTRLLVPVTSFFRNPGAFAVLAGQSLPSLLAERPDGHVVRVWVPGCSTGEEPYSLAIVLTEVTEGIGRDMGFKIFATDVNREGIDVARRGLYPSTIAAAVGAQRLARFFAAEPTGYRVNPWLRRSVIFSHQDLLQDPPFSHLDLLSCRNVLIYLDQEAQRRVVCKFHFALSPGGILFLGPQEVPKGAQRLFEVEDSRWKIFRRLGPQWLFPEGEQPRREAQAARNG